MTAYADGTATGTQPCPRCGADDPGSPSCRSCGLVVVCPHCQSELRRPTRARYCGECGSPIRQPPWDPAQQATTPVETIQGLVHRAAVLSHADAGDGGASVRQARARLGRALAASGRLMEADAEYVAALAEPGATPPSSQLLLLRAGLEADGDRVGGALRLLLEAVSKDAAELSPLLGDLPSLITAEVAEEHGTWLATTFLTDLAAAGVSEPVESTAHVLVALAELLRGNVAEAVAAAARAARTDPGTAQRTVRRALMDQAWAERSAERQETGPFALGLAQVCHALGLDGLALEQVNRALEAGLPGDGWPDAEAYRLRALLRRETDPAAAAEDLFHAGCRMGWRGDFPAAIELFQQSDDLGLDRQDLFWYWSDDLRCTVSGLDAVADAEILARAGQLWERGRKRGPITAGSAWAYLVRAAIRFSLAELDPDTAAEHTWQAAIDVESALALDPSSTFAWTAVFNAWSDERYWAVAAHARSRANELAPDGDQAVDGAAVVAAYWLRPHELAGSIQQYRERHEPADPWIDFVDGLAHLQDGDVAGALGLLEAAHAKDPDDVRTRYHLARARTVARQAAESRRDWEQLWQRIRPGGPADRFGNWDFRVLTACAVGDADACRRWAEEIAAVAQRERLLSRHPPWLQVVAALSAGKPDDAGRWLASVLECPVQPGDLRHMLVDLECLDVLLGGRAGSGRGGQPQATLEKAPGWLGRLVGGLVAATDRAALRIAASAPAKRARTNARRRLAELRSGLSKDPIDKVRAELLRAMRRLEAEPRTPTGDAADALAELAAISAQDMPRAQMRVAVQARTAALLAEAGRWAEAADAYRELAADPTPFLEATTALRTVRSSVRQKAERRLRRGERGAAADLAELVIELGPDRAGPADSLVDDTAVHALTLVLTGRPAGPAVARALDAARAADEPDPARSLATRWLRLMPDSAAYWTVEDTLRALRGTADIPENDLDAARAELCSFLDQRFHAADRDTKDPLSPAATPVAVELGHDLVPAVAYSDYASWSLFKTHIPALRERLKEQTGVKVPGIRVRTNPARVEAGEYALLLEEVVVGRGTTAAACAFVRDVSTLPPGTEIVTAGVDPLTGSPGAWIDRQGAARLREHGVPLWEEAIEYVMADLERCLRANLGAFLRLDHVEWLLHDGDAEARGKLAKRVLPSTTSRWRFAWVLRALAADRRSLTDLDTILEVAEEIGIDRDPAAVVAAARERLGRG